MRKLVSLVVSFLIVLTIISLNVSCEKKRNSVSKSRYFYGIVFDLDRYEGFKIMETDLQNLDVFELEEKKSIINSLNKALQDYPNLSKMLESDKQLKVCTYRGQEAFYTKLQKFADQYYNKVKNLFPEITVSQFLYNSAIGYAIANDWEEESREFEVYFENALMPNGAVLPKISSTVNPTFDEQMIHGFWVAYMAEKFDLALEPVKTDQNTSLKPLTLDTPISINIFAKHQAVLQCVLESIFDEMGRIDNKNYTLESYELIYDKLKSEEIINGAKPIGSDFFIHTGLSTTYISKLVVDFYSQTQPNVTPLSLGHILYSCLEYIYSSESQLSINVAVEICGIVAQTIQNQEHEFDNPIEGYDVQKWRREKIKN